MAKRAAPGGSNLTTIGNISTSAVPQTRKLKNLWNIDDYTGIKFKKGRDIAIKNAVYTLSFTVDRNWLSSHAENFSQFGINNDAKNQQNEYQAKEKPEAMKKLFHYFLEIVSRCNNLSIELNEKQKKRDKNKKKKATNDGMSDEEDEDEENEDDEDDDEEISSLRVSEYMELFVENIMFNNSIDEDEEDEEEIGQDDDMDIVNEYSRPIQHAPTHVKYSKCAGYTFWLFIFKKEINPNAIGQQIIKAATDYNILKDHCPLPKFAHESWKDIKDVNELSKLSDIYHDFDKDAEKIIPYNQETVNLSDPNCLISATNLFHPLFGVLNRVGEDIYKNQSCENIASYLNCDIEEMFENIFSSKRNNRNTTDAYGNEIEDSGGIDTIRNIYFRKDIKKFLYRSNVYSSPNLYDKMLPERQQYLLTGSLNYLNQILADDKLFVQDKEEFDQREKELEQEAQSSSNSNDESSNQERKKLKKSQDKNSNDMDYYNQEFSFSKKTQRQQQTQPQQPQQQIGVDLGMIVQTDNAIDVSESNKQVEQVKITVGEFKLNVLKKFGFRTSIRKGKDINKYSFKKNFNPDRLQLASTLLNTSAISNTYISGYGIIKNEMNANCSILKTDRLDKCGFKVKIFDVNTGQSRDEDNPNGFLYNPNVVKRTILILNKLNGLKQYDQRCTNPDSVISNVGIMMNEYTRHEGLFDTTHHDTKIDRTLGSFSNVEIIHMERYEHIYFLNDMHKILNVVRKSSYDSFSMDLDEVKLHVILRSWLGHKSKSFVLDLLRLQMSIPKSVVNISFESLKSNIHDTINNNDETKQYDELDPGMIYSNGGGQNDEKNSRLKQQLSQNMIQAAILEFDSEGKRKRRIYYCETIGVIMGNTNLSLHKMEPAMKRRWQIFNISTQVGERRNILESILASHWKGVNFDGYKNSVRKIYYRLQMLTFHVFKFMYTGILEDIVPLEAVIITLLVSRRLVEKGLPAPNPGIYQKIIKHAKINCIQRALQQTFFVKGAPFYGHPITLSMLTKIDKLLYVTVEDTVRALGECCDLIIDKFDPIVKLTLRYLFEIQNKSTRFNYTSQHFKNDFNTIGVSDDKFKKKKRNPKKLTDNNNNDSNDNRPLEHTQNLDDHTMDVLNEDYVEKADVKDANYARIDLKTITSNEYKKMMALADKITSEIPNMHKYFGITDVIDQPDIHIVKDILQTMVNHNIFHKPFKFVDIKSAHIDYRKKTKQHSIINTAILNNKLIEEVEIDDTQKEMSFECARFSHNSFIMHYSTISNDQIRYSTPEDIIKDILVDILSSKYQQPIKCAFSNDKRYPQIVTLLEITQKDLDKPKNRDKIIYIPSIVQVTDSHKKILKNLDSHIKNYSVANDIAILTDLDSMGNEKRMKVICQTEERIDPEKLNIDPMAMIRDQKRNKKHRLSKQKDYGNNNNNNISKKQSNIANIDEQKKKKFSKLFGNNNTQKNNNDGKEETEEEESKDTSQNTPPPPLPVSQVKSTEDELCAHFVGLTLDELFSDDFNGWSRFTTEELRMIYKKFDYNKGDDCNFIIDQLNTLNRKYKNLNECTRRIKMPQDYDCDETEYLVPDRYPYNKYETCVPDIYDEETFMKIDPNTQPNIKLVPHWILLAEKNTNESNPFKLVHMNKDETKSAYFKRVAETYILNQQRYKMIASHPKIIEDRINLRGLGHVDPKKENQMILYPDCLRISTNTQTAEERWRSTGLAIGNFSGLQKYIIDPENRKKTKLIGAYIDDNNNIKKEDGYISFIGSIYEKQEFINSSSKQRKKKNNNNNNNSTTSTPPFQPPQPPTILTSNNDLKENDMEVDQEIPLINRNKKNNTSIDHMSISDDDNDDKNNYKNQFDDCSESEFLLL